MNHFNFSKNLEDYENLWNLKLKTILRESNPRSWDEYTPRPQATSTRPTQVGLERLIFETSESESIEEQKLTHIKLIKGPNV